MRNRWRLTLFVFVLATPIFSCGDDDNRVIPPKLEYKALDGERDNVLFNLDKAYNERNIDRYDELLDKDFIFHFSIADWQNGSVDVQQWNRTSEISANRNMFDPNFSKPGVDPVSRISLVLTYANGDDKWTQITPEDQVKYPDETWYEKTVTYQLAVKAGSLEWGGIEIEASYTVRWATVEGKQFWQIVIWRDDTSGSLGIRSIDGQAVPSGSEITWGQLKELYSR